MDDSLLTKCPHCKTLFRIQHNHLAVADGEVRCGVCFKVFNAKTEGISYSEESAPDNKEQETSREQAAEIVQHLELPEQDKTEPKNEAEAPDPQDINQLVIKDESVEQLFAAPARKRFDRPWLWGGLCTLALSVLLLQWLWFNLDRYSLDPRWRPWYQLACSYLGCQPAEFRSLQQIKTERLTVKTHPKYSNVLIVDLIINNRATLPQPMPSLNLAFYDINGATLSSRVLRPDEYLDSSISLESMPVETPIHLSFSIIDPGAEAVNYGVQLTL